ncbi:MAG: phosphate propanoyltransferase [Bacilli bacterium]|nr:phosphate propanoyltransferase [Bacilli bacterium]
MKTEVMIETSARHVHVTKETFEILFGESAKELTVKKYLSQPGQFASEQKVTLVGPKKTIANVSILGPFRKADQVEISATDARTLGVDIAVRESGDIAGTPGIKVVGPCGEVDLKEGVIVAKRHIHATPEDAKEAGLVDKQVVSVKVVNDCRSIVFGDVVVRVSPNFKWAMHIDTDESNAGMVGNATGEIIK